MMKLKNFQLLFLIAILVIVTRAIFFVVVVPYNPEAQVRDEYLAIARNVVDGEGFSRIRRVDGVVVPTTQRGPVPVYFFAAALWLMGDHTLSIAISNWIMDAITGVLLYLIALEIFRNKYIALMSSFAFIFYGPEMYYSWQAISESLFGVILAAFVLCFLRTVRSPSVGGFIISGILLGLGALTRPVMLYYLPLAIVMLIWLLQTRRGTAIKWAAIFSLSCIGVVLPWTIRNYLIFDQIILVNSNFGITLYHGNYALGEPDFLQPRTSEEGTASFRELVPGTMTQIQFDNRAGTEAVKIIKQYPVRYLMLSTARFFQMWYFIEGPLASRSYLVLAFHLLFIVLAALAFIYYRDGWWRQGLFLILLVLFNNVIYAPVRSNVRYIVPVVPFVMLIAAVTIVNAWFYVKRTYLRQASPM